MRDRGMAWLPRSAIAVMRYAATLRSRTGCAPTEVGGSVASTHPSPEPSPRRGEGESAAPMAFLTIQRSCFKSSSYRRVAV